MSECGNELLFVSPGAGGKELWMEWCFITEDAVLLSSSSSSSDAEPKRESKKKTNWRMVFHSGVLLINANDYCNLVKAKQKGYIYFEVIWSS